MTVVCARQLLTPCGIAGHVGNESLEAEIDAASGLTPLVELHHRLGDGRTRCIVSRLFGTKPNVFTKCSSVLRSSGSEHSSMGTGAIRDIGLLLCATRCVGSANCVVSPSYGQHTCAARRNDRNCAMWALVWVIATVAELCLLSSLRQAGGASAGGSRRPAPDGRAPGPRHDLLPAVSDDTLHPF